MESLPSALLSELRLRLKISNNLARDVQAEFFGTFFLMLTGFCVNAQRLLTTGTPMSTNFCQSLGWGLALMLAVLMCQRTSGAHFNPAVTFFQLTQGRISLRRFLLYVTVQNAAAFFASLLVFVLYFDAVNEFDGGVRAVRGPRETASIWGTYPSPFLTVRGAVIDQIFCTMLLCIGVSSVSDKRNEIPSSWQPLLVAMVLTLLGLCLNRNAAYAMNPARDFAPRLMTSIVGYGWEPFSHNNFTWFWVPIVCPMIGAALGAWIYEFVIGFHLPEEELKSSKATSASHVLHIESSPTLEMT